MTGAGAEKLGRAPSGGHVVTEWSLQHDCVRYGCDHGDSGNIVRVGRERPTHATINGHPAVILTRKIAYGDWCEEDADA